MPRKLGYLDRKESVYDRLDKVFEKPVPKTNSKPSGKSGGKSGNGKIVNRGSGGKRGK